MTVTRRRAYEFLDANASAVLLFVLLTHAVIATVFVPVHSDISVYRRYAAAVATGIEDGTGFSVARDNIIRDGARRSGLPEPASGDLMMEYPPVSVIWMAIAGMGTDYDAPSGSDGDSYEVRYRLVTFIVELILILILVRWASPYLVASSGGSRLSGTRIAVYGVTSLILGNLLFDRLDLLVGALLLLSIVLLVRGWWPASFLVLALAINFKASPIALAPLWVVASLPHSLFANMRARPAPLIAAAATRALALAGLAAAIFLPFLVIEGTRSLDFLRFRALQGVQIESIPGTILLILHEVGLPLEVTATYGTLELDTPLTGVLATASPLLLLIAVVAIVVLYVRAATASPGSSAPASLSRATVPMHDGRLVAGNPSLLLTATVATILLTLVTSKLLSPQFLLWVLPLVPLLDIGESRTRTFWAWFIITCLVTTVIFPYLLGRILARVDPSGNGYLDPMLLGVVLITARNVLLIWLTWLAVRVLLRPTTDIVPRAGGTDATVPLPAGTAGA